MMVGIVFCFLHTGHRQECSALKECIKSSRKRGRKAVQEQLLTLLRAVNRIRKTASVPPVPLFALRLHRKQVKPFEERTRAQDAKEVAEGIGAEETCPCAG